MAYAEIYNTVRYFYPSKAVQSINWDKFAIYGVREIQNCETQQALIEKLTALFRPLCPEIKIDTTEIFSTNLYPLQKKSRRKYVHYGSGNPPSMFGITGLLYKLYKPYYTKIKNVTANDSLFWYKDSINRIYFAMPSAAVKGNTPDYKHIQKAVDTITIKQLDIKKRAGFLNADMRSHRLASIIIAWGIFRHFYPYSNYNEVAWNDMLSEALQNAVYGDKVDFYFCLRNMLAPLNDGHIFTMMAGQQGLVGFSFVGRKTDVFFKNINDTIVVEKGTSMLPQGSIINAVNGTDVKDWIRDREKYISAGPHYKRIQCAREFLTSYYPNRDTIFHLNFTTPDGQANIIDVPIKGFVLNEDSAAFIAHNNDIYVLKFSGMNAGTKTLHKILQAISNDDSAKGVIIDLRNSGFMDHKFLGFFTDTVLHSAPFKIPIITYPKQKNNIRYRTDGFKIKPKRKKINIPVIFITDGSVLSYGESVMGIVDHYKLGYIVGEATTGVNGDIARLPLPVHNIMSYTGMRVDKHDGSPLFCIGITPTHPVNTTVTDFQHGIDAPMQKALDIIKQAYNEKKYNK
ncbi:MAG: S41 family peptidase [Prevotellaceae bacterium]|nr:S41 family peptidase [Prevotellaceae bacterium]